MDIFQFIKIMSVGERKANVSARIQGKLTARMVI